MTRLNLTRLHPAYALRVARRLLQHAHEGLEAMIRIGDRKVVYRFGPPWPGGRGLGARPLEVWRADLGRAGESCPWPRMDPAPKRPGSLGAAVAARDWERVEDYYEGQEREYESPLAKQPWDGRI